MTRPLRQPDGHDEFRRRFANWDGLRSVCLTFDVDFAPEFMIEDVLALLERTGARATFFATHASEALAREAKRGFHEVGAHPNLAPGSTQPGEGAESIVSLLREAYPQLMGNRFHLLAHSYRDLSTLARAGVAYDVSALRFNCPYVLPAWHADLEMTLLTYMWEDGVCENAGHAMEVGSIDLDSPGLKIVNFHPMNVFINGSDGSARREFMNTITDLRECPRELADKHRHVGPGAGDVLRGLLTALSDRGVEFATVGEMVGAFRSESAYG